MGAPRSQRRSGLGGGIAGGAGKNESDIGDGRGTLVESDPDMAVRLSEVIGNEGTRRYQMERAARRWLETDQIAARAWISGSSLPEEAKQRLLAQARLDCAANLHGYAHAFTATW